MKITLRMNPESISDAVKQLNEYRDSLPRKAELIRQRVTEELKNLVEEGFNGAFYDGLLYEGWKVPSVDVYTKNDDEISVVIADGKEAVFIEFGAGVYFNPGGSAHPSRPPGIVNIGEYGKGRGKRQIWGYYDKNGELHLTHGTPASMPMFLAAKEIAEKIPSIARDVFQGGDST